MKPTSPHSRSPFLTDQQRAALSSGDSTAMQAADDAALAEAILASLAQQENESVQYNAVTEDELVEQAKRESLAYQGNNAGSASPTISDYEQQMINTEKLHSWLDANGFDVVKNGGGGHNDCLLISLMQHATGDYETEHAADVDDCRAFLNRLDPTIQRDDALPAMHHAIGKLVDKINNEKNCELRIAIVAPGIDGEPTYHYYGKGTRFAMIFDQSGHFDAVVPRRTRRA